jgi:FkbM family methyltransferase
VSGALAPWVESLLLRAGSWFGLEPELRLVPLVCDPTRAFVDVGAHEGRFTRVALRHATRVLAVEPDATCAPGLARLSARVEVVVAALGDLPGRARFHVPELDGRPLRTRGSLLAGADPGLPVRSLEVDVSCLDDVVLGAVGAVKIDVEGHELAVLRSGEATLARERPALIVEIEERHRAGAVAEVSAWLDARGYDGFFLERGVLAPVARFVAARHQDPRAAKPPGRRSARADRAYVNNFVFAHRADGRVRRALGFPGAA